MKTFKLFIDRKSNNPAGYDLWGYSLYDCSDNINTLMEHKTKREYGVSKKGAVERSINCYSWGIDSVAPVLNKVEDDVTVTIFITNKNVYKRLEGSINVTYRIEMEQLREAIDKVYGLVCIEYVNRIQNKNVLDEKNVKKEKYERITDFCSKM